MLHPSAEYNIFVSSGVMPVMHILRSKKIVLASGSPRRQELVQNIGLKVDLCPSLFEEDLDPKKYGNNFGKFVEDTALHKAVEVHERLFGEGRPADVVIAADTMVTLDGQMFGKPTSKDDAFEILSRLSGKTHTVFTGVAVKTPSDVRTFVEKTNVQFGKLTKEQILGYIATGEPMDKAGGYGIQGIGGTLVERIDGDYFTVMGLPLYRLCAVLCQICEDEEKAP